MGEPLNLDYTMSRDEQERVRRLNLAVLVLEAVENTYGSGEYYWTEEAKQLVNHFGGQKSIQGAQDLFLSTARNMPEQLLDQYINEVGGGYLRLALVKIYVNKFGSLSNVDHSN